MTESNDCDIYKKLTKEELIDIIKEFEESDNKSAEMYWWQANKIKQLREINDKIKTENQQLKAQQTQLAVDKLEELLSGLKFKDVIRGCVDFNKGFDLACKSTENKIEEMINELKGE